MNETILCIPKLNNSVSYEYLVSIIERMQIGEILSIVEKPLSNNEHYKRIVIKID